MMFQHLETKKYTPNKVSEWSDIIGNKVIEKLRVIAPFFKYIVSTCIIQKVGAGIHAETVAYWDQKTDGALMVKFENDALICLCTIVGVAI
ncbi:hypothetical protein EON65_48110 [archaeon]|nr:MAG: hypothetical protein EON65_48110 [archaeon]